MLELSVSNNATSRLAAALEVTDTEISIDAVDAGLFPALSDGKWCPLTLVDGQGGYEIVHAIKRSGGIFTVKRGQENTRAKAFPVGTRIDMRLTKACVEELATKPISDPRLPARLQPKNATIPDNDANNILENGVYDTNHETKNGAATERGILQHSVSDTTDIVQEWTAISGYRRFLRIKKDGGWTNWKEITIQPDFLSPWALKPIAEPFPLMDFIANVALPPQDKHYRFVKLTASDAYNAGILVSETIEGSAPYIKAHAKLELPGSPLNGQIIRLINTERRFLRAGSSGTLEDSDNRWHGHSGRTDNAGGHNHSYAGSYGVMRETSESGKQNPSRQDQQRMTDWAGDHAHTLQIDGSGGSEARPRNIGVTYFMRVL